MNSQITSSVYEWNSIGVKFKDRNTNVVWTLHLLTKMELSPHTWATCMAQQHHIIVVTQNSSIQMDKRIKLTSATNPRISRLLQHETLTVECKLHYNFIISFSITILRNISLFWPLGFDRQLTETYGMCHFLISSFVILP